ncbi:MAG: cache domain-containing protein, partial [Pseudobdellovibrio sp.]
MTNIGNKSAPGAVKMRRELFFRAFAIALVTLASFLLAADIFIFVPITHQLASARLNQDSEQINGRLTAFVLRVETLSRVGRDWGAAGVFDLERKELLRDLFRSIVNNASESSGVVIADDTGHENLLIRLPDQTWLQRITNPVKWNKRGEFLTLDKDGRQMGREFKDTDYDARQRPWFKEGQMIPAGSSSVFWTEPFIFQSTQEPGVVAVVAYGGRSGRRYFLGHNLRLIDLSYFTSKVGTGPQGFSVVLADDGRVVGLPRAAKFSSEEDIKKLVLKNPDQIGVPPLASGYEAWQKGGRQENVLQKFSQNGIAWLAEFKKVS